MEPSLPPSQLNGAVPSVGADASRYGTLKSHAKTFVAAGLCALPAIRRDGKKRVALSTWKEFQSRLPSSDELDSGFKPDVNAVCLICGEVSGNLEMIDFDNWEGGGAEAFDTWRESIESASPGLLDRLVIESTPAGGRHVVYRSEAAVTGNRALAQRRIEFDSSEAVVIGSKEHVPRKDSSGLWFVEITLIETRGEGGLFLCAPSEGYALIQGDLADPPVISADDRDLLIGCARTLDELPVDVIGTAPKAAAPSNGTRPGDDFNQRGDIRDLLIKHGWTLTREAENEHWCRPGKSRGTSATLKDRVFYNFSSNAPPFESPKPYAPFAVYTLLEHHGDYSAAASALAASGFGDAGRTSKPDRSTSGAGTSSATSSPVEPELMSVGALIAAYPKLRRPVIHGLLREGETMNVIAAPKTNKSWLTTDLAIAVATGRPWLGRYETVRGEVLIIDNELHRETSAYRLPKVAEARNVSMCEIAQRIYVANLRGRLRDIDSLGSLFADLAPGRFKVIVLDAFYRFMPVGGDENDNGMMANIYNTIDHYADQLGCCFVLIHHSSKGNQSGKSVTDVGAGAGAQSRATDTHLVLRPHDERDVVVLDAAVRSWPPVQPTCLRWSYPVWTVEDALDATALKREQSGRRRGQKTDDAATTPAWTTERFVSEFIGDEPVKPSQVRASASQVPGLSGRKADDLLSNAESEGLIERCTMPGRGGPVGYKRVASSVAEGES